MGVEKVVVSNRLTDSPCCLVTGAYGWNHEGASSSRQLPSLLHGIQEDDGGESNSLYCHGSPPEGRRGPERQDRQGSYLAPLRDIPPCLRIQSWSANRFRGPHPPSHQTRPGDRR